MTVTMENIPWAIGGGIVSPSIARMLAYQATSGAEGIAGVGDFVVRQLAVAGGSVRIGPGGGVLVNRYPGARNESYMCRAGDETPVAVPQNAGGSTRHDLVIARVDDWNMSGGQPTPPELPTNTVAAAKFQVITNVSASTKTAAQLKLNYPAIALARIAMPPGTAAVTQAMITDLREVAVPRRKRDLRAVAQVAGRDNTLSATGDAGEQFPDDGRWTVEVPEWATRVRVKGDLFGIQQPVGTNYSWHWVEFGTGRSDKFITQAVASDNAHPGTSISRIVAGLADDRPIPASMRGQSITVRFMGQKRSGNVNLKADWATAMALDMEFLEAPTEDL